MSGVMQRFFIVSIVMWIAPVAIIYGFNHHIFPGSSELSASSHTLISGFLAVISVNLVIGYYIFMALKEPVNHEPEPDPKFLAEAKASVNQHNNVASSNDDNIHARDKAD